MTNYEFIESLKDRPAAFNSAILGRGEYWSKQKEIARSVVKNPITLVHTGNMCGKTFLAAGLLHWFLFTRPGCIVLATAPSQTQLEEVLWKEVEKAYRGSRVPLGGRLLRSPLKVDLGNGWHALAYSTTSVERLSGHHAPELFIIVDEASGVEDAIYEALRSCGPSRELLIGNPLRPNGTFYDRCRAAIGNPLACVIQIDSRDGPHSKLLRSPWGLADATWLESVRNDYGESGIWWNCHVEGRFPDDATDGVFRRTWIEDAEKTIHQPGGERRISIDLSLGIGGDDSVICVRDDNGVLYWKDDKRWSLEVTANQTALAAQRFGVRPERITWDVAGIGADFANRLQSVNLIGCKPFLAGGGGSNLFANHRAAVAWKARNRLDPDYQAMSPHGIRVPQVPFSLAKVPPKSLANLKDQLLQLRYHLGPHGEITLEKAEDYALRLKRSPDQQSAFCQSFSHIN